MGAWGSEQLQPVTKQGLHCGEWGLGGVAGPEVPVPQTTYGLGGDEVRGRSPGSRWPDQARNEGSQNLSSGLGGQWEHGLGGDRVFPPLARLRGRPDGGQEERH